MTPRQNCKREEIDQTGSIGDWVPGDGNGISTLIKRPKR